jgi:hypothetical protein
MSWTGVAVLVLLLTIVAVARGSRFAFGFLIVFLVIAVASGLLPPLGIVTGINDDEVAVSLGESDDGETERDGVRIGKCTWEPESQSAALTIANRASEPRFAQVDVVFGSAEVASSPEEIHSARRYPDGDRHWLLPPAGLPAPNQPDYDPGWLIRMPAPDDDRNQHITWCYATIADVEPV